MRAEGGPTAIRVSCSLGMNDLQSQNSFDFVPKSDYNEKWHLENKCLFHNQQYLEGGTCEAENSHAKGRLCNLDSFSKEKFKLNTDGNSLNKKSGDWKYDSESVEASLPENIIHEPVSSDWKWKNVYSVSDLDRSNRWNQSAFKTRNRVSTSLLRDVYNKIDRYEDPAKVQAKSNCLHNFREYLVNYQESCGVPRTEYSFSSLIRIMGQATGRSLLALLYVMLNIIPVVEVFLYILRFILDKVISIRSSKDIRQRMIRCFVFATELFSVYVCLIFIFGFIVLPIVQMVIGIIGKIMLYN